MHHSNNKHGGGGGVGGGRGGGGGGSCLHDYGSICTLCGSFATVIGIVYGIIALLLRLYLHPESLQYFESFPYYSAALTYVICGLFTLAFTWKRYRNSCLLRMSSYLALCNAALSSALTLCVVFTNLKVLRAMSRECEDLGNYQCGCKVEAFSPAFPSEKTIIFESPHCTHPVTVLNVCLMLMVPTSISGVFLSIFMWRLLDELSY